MRHNDPNRISLIDSIREVVQHELDSRTSPAKNGETWQAYLIRTFTIDRIGLAVLLVYQLGGGVNEARTAIQAAAGRAVAASQIAETASQKAETASHKADEAIDNVKQVQEQLEVAVTELKRQSALNADLHDRVKLSITRTEFNTALDQRVLPRLDRIEKQGGLHP